jgi:T-complex protein 1 subunit beta
MSGKKVTVTNDGATILKSIPVDNPSAKIIVDTSITQDNEVGDGTTSVAVLAGELLREAEKLVLARIHPQTIIAGWRKAVTVARQTLTAASVDNSADMDKFKNDLINIAHTTLSSKILATEDDYFAKLAVEAILRLKGADDLNMIQIVKKLGGNLRDSYLDEGFILDKKFGVGAPRRIENAKVMIANTSMDHDKVKIYGAKVKVDSIANLAEIEEAEKYKMKLKVDKIVDHGINCFINRQLIYNYPEQLLAKAGVSSIEHADFEGVERLALVLGADICSTFDNPDKVALGHCDLIEEVVIGEDRVIRFSGVEKGEACTVVLRGASQQMLEEAERSLHDALCVIMQTVKNTRTVLGGGASEMMMACAVDKLAQETSGKEAYAIEAFARALRAIPTTLANNAGFDASDLVAKLRPMHAAGDNTLGVDMDTGKVSCMIEKRVTESFFSKLQSLVSAHEAAEIIVRVDNIIRCAPRQRREPDHGH